MLILCGSYMGTMERAVLGERSPLYGRRTGQYQLLPLGFREIGGFFPGLGAVKRIEGYAILGGVPAYLEKFAGCEDPLEEVPRLVLRKGSFFYDEPRFLLIEELREPANYFSLLRAIAWGKTKLNEILQASALADRSAASRYLDTLRELGLVERMLPVTEKAPHKSRRGIYRVRDHFFRFWFRFVLPHRSELEEGEVERVMERHIRPHFGEFVARTFEEVAREYVWELGRRDQLPFHPVRVGAWWDGRTEIDVVALGEKGEVLVGECKWSSHPVDLSVLGELERKTTPLLAHLTALSGGRPVPRLFYALFSRFGFTADLVALARNRGDLLLISAEEMG